MENGVVGGTYIEAKDREDAEAARMRDAQASMIRTLFDPNVISQVHEVLENLDENLWAAGDY